MIGVQMFRTEHLPATGNFDERLSYAHSEPAFYRMRYGDSEIAPVSLGRGIPTRVGIPSQERVGALSWQLSFDAVLTKRGVRK